MEAESKIKLDNIIKELSDFLEKDFSSRFRNLSNKEDRQLFFLARILVQLKQISRSSKVESKNPEKKIVQFPNLQRVK